MKKIPMILMLFAPYLLFGLYMSENIKALSAGLILFAAVKKSVFQQKRSVSISSCNSFSVPTYSARFTVISRYGSKQNRIDRQFLLVRLL